MFIRFIVSIDILLTPADVEEGVTRSRRLQIKKHEQASRVQHLEGMFTLLRDSSDVEAKAHLARLRLGDSVEDIVDDPQLKDSIVGNSQSEAEDSSTSSPPNPTPKHGSIAHDAHGNTQLNPLLFDRACRANSTGNSEPSAKALAPASKGVFLSKLFEIKDLRRLSIPRHDGQELMRPIAPPITRTTQASIPISPASESDELQCSQRISNVVVPLRSKIDVATRQAMSPTISLHPNFGSHFGNLPLSSSIRTNHQPPDIQESQIHNLSIPVWAMKCVNTRLDPGSLHPAINGIYDEASIRCTDCM